MLITRIDDTTINGANDPIRLQFKGNRAAPKPLTMGTSLRQRSGNTPVREAASFGAIEQEVSITKNQRHSMSMADFNLLVYELFAPGPQVRTIEGTKEPESDLDGITLTNQVVITSFGEIRFSEWKATLLFLDPYWSEKMMPAVATTSPIEVGGSAFTKPLIALSAGDTVTRQHVTFTDRTGHGVQSLMVSVEPVETHSEENYLIVCRGVPQAFALVDGRLFFRVSIKATEPTHVDIWMGASINGGTRAGSLETFGMALDAAIAGWEYQVDITEATTSGLAPSLAWVPAVTGDHSDRRRYSFGVNNGRIELVEQGFGSDRASYANDADGYTLVTGVEADRITGLSFTVTAGYQKSEQEAAQDNNGNPVMRVAIRNLGGRVGQYNTEFTIGLTTIPQWRSYTNRRSEPIVSEPLTGGDAEYIGEQVTTTTVWANPAGVDSLQEVLHLLELPYTQQEPGVFDITFPNAPPEVSPISMRVSPRDTTTTVSGPSRYQFPSGDGMAEVVRSISSTYHNFTQPDALIFESYWINPATGNRIGEDPETAGLLPHAVQGQIRVSVVYWLRDRPDPITAWTDVVTGSFPSGTTVNYSNLTVETPGAVQIAIRLEPVAESERFADWGTLAVTGAPTIELDTDKTPQIISSAGINALHVNGWIQNDRTGERITLQDVLVDDPGLYLDMATGAFEPIGGVGPRQGSIYVSSGAELLRLLPGANVWSVGGDIEAGDVEWHYVNRWAV